MSELRACLFMCDCHKTNVLWWDLTKKTIWILSNGAHIWTVNTHGITNVYAIVRFDFIEYWTTAHFRAVSLSLSVEEKKGREKMLTKARAKKHFYFILIYYFFCTRWCLSLLGEKEDIKRKHNAAASSFQEEELKKNDDVIQCRRKIQILFSSSCFFVRYF